MDSYSLLRRSEPRAGVSTIHQLVVLARLWPLLWQDFLFFLFDPSMKLPADSLFAQEGQVFWKNETGPKGWFTPGNIFWLCQTQHNFGALEHLERVLCAKAPTSGIDVGSSRNRRLGRFHHLQSRVWRHCVGLQSPSDGLLDDRAIARSS